MEPLTFGEWLKCTKTRHPHERDFRRDGLQNKGLLEGHFEDVRDLISAMETVSNNPHSAAVEGAVRCWVRWRKHEEEKREQRLKELETMRQENAP